MLRRDGEPERLRALVEGGIVESNDTLRGEQEVIEYDPTRRPRLPVMLARTSDHRVSAAAPHHPWLCTVRHYQLRRGAGPEEVDRYARTTVTA